MNLEKHSCRFSPNYPLGDFKTKLNQKVFVSRICVFALRLLLVAAWRQRHRNPFFQGLETNKRSSRWPNVSKCHPATRRLWIQKQRDTLKIWITRTCAKSLQNAHIKQAKNGKHRVQTRKIQAKHYTNIEYDTFGFKDMRCISCSALDSRPEQHLEQHPITPL